MRQRWLTSAIGALVFATAGGWIQTASVQAVSFEPPSDNTAPSASTGGASRSSFFAPPAENAAPRTSTGGASRGSFFIPPADNSAPEASVGGASRDSFFAPPVDNAAPIASIGGSSRDVSIPTVAAADAMTAVLPDSFYGTTLEARPTILVYVPPSNARSAVFSLKNEAKDTVYQTTLAVPETGGVISVKLPDDAPELAIAQNYQWYVALEIDSELAVGSPFVDGWIRRIAPSAELSLALSQSDDLSEIAALGANGVWYDTAAQLATIQADQGNDTLSAHWFELLESVGLADIAVAPIVQ